MTIIAVILQVYATTGESWGHTHNYTLHGRPDVIVQIPKIHVVSLDGDTGGKGLSSQKRPQGFLVLKVIKRRTRKPYKN